MSTWLMVCLSGSAGLIIGLCIATNAASREVDRWIAAYLKKYDDLDRTKRILAHVRNRLDQISSM